MIWMQVLRIHHRLKGDMEEVREESLDYHERDIDGFWKIHTTDWHDGLMDDSIDSKGWGATVYLLVQVHGIQEQRHSGTLLTQGTERISQDYTDTDRISMSGEDESNSIPTDSIQDPMHYPSHHPGRYPRRKVGLEWGKVSPAHHPRLVESEYLLLIVALSSSP
ncbi:unnamed protein product [Allacma fusca]|uniref:Uncharacterized protein n=1 Tax=Allacma fusca TaxID=39272 RepID=A0A8J2KNT1_9HEXA|nr:unnamed protein product [Allacma fusca]